MILNTDRQTLTEEGTFEMSIFKKKKIEDEKSDGRKLRFRLRLKLKSSVDQTTAATSTKSPFVKFSMSSLTSEWYYLSRSVDRPNLATCNVMSGHG